MPASSFKTYGFATLIAFGLTSFAQAQLDSSCSPFYGCDNDLQWFEPVDLDLDCQGCCDQCGFFFKYDKLAWTASGERIQVGDPNTVQQQFRFLAGVPLDPISGQPIQPVLLTNSIRNGVPNASFHTGDRYEFGYWAEDGKGWLLGVLNGPDWAQSFNIGLDGGAQENHGELQSPLGDVFVSFRTQTGALAGFLDADEGGLGVGFIFGTDDDGDGILDGDGDADDINQNGQHGPDGFDLEPPGNDPDTEVEVPPDYGDLVTFTTAFRNVNLRNNLKTNGFEIMRAYRLDNSHFKVKNQNNSFVWQYGARFLQLDDNFVFNGTGGLVLGDGMWDTSIVNNIVGPQVGYDWNHSRGRWTFQSKGKFLFGYNIRNWDQSGFIGEDLIPSQHNHPLFMRAKSFSYGKSDDDFSPVGELRLDLKYRVTDNVSLKAGWTGTFVDNIKRASTHVDYALYDETGKVMGFTDGDTEELFANGVNFGIEIVQ